VLRHYELNPPLARRSLNGREIVPAEVSLPVGVGWKGEEIRVKMVVRSEDVTLNHKKSSATVLRLLRSV
jgi:hypothetical protein